MSPTADVPIVNKHDNPKTKPKYSIPVEHQKNKALYIAGSFCRASDIGLRTRSMHNEYNL